MPAGGSTESSAAEAAQGGKTCYRHPDRETAVSCSDCGRAVCTDCMVYGAVGIKCPECARQPRSAIPRLKPERLARTIAAVAIGGILIGYLLVTLQRFGLFFALILGYLVGLAMGELVLWASGRYRGSETARLAVAGAIWSYLFPFILFYGLDVGAVADSMLGAPFVVLGAVLAAYVAYRRVL